MILFVGATGIAAWNMRLVRGHSREAVCLNDGFSIDIPHVAPKAPRVILNQMRLHSEELNGRTVSVSQISLLT